MGDRVVGWSPRLEGTLRNPNSYAKQSEILLRLIRTLQFVPFLEMKWNLNMGQIFFFVRDPHKFGVFYEVF